MKHLIFFSVASLIIALVNGCATTGVPSADAPEKKLHHAFALVQHLDRPFPSEGLIQEAMEIYQKDNNQAGLARAYWTYGVFFQSDAVNKMEKAYGKNGFLDKSVKFENRYDKAMEYFDKAESIAKNRADYNFLSVIAYNKAINYETTGDKTNECQHYELSLAWNRKVYETVPDMKYYVPGMGRVGFYAYKKVFSDYMKQSGCN